MSIRALSVGEKFFGLLGVIAYVWLYILWIAFAFSKAGAFGAFLALVFPLGPVALPVIVGVIEGRIPWMLCVLALVALGAGTASGLLGTFKESAEYEVRAAANSREVSTKPASRRKRAS